MKGGYKVNIKLMLDPEDPKDKLRIARAFYDYCTVNVVYSYTRSYFTIEQIPEYVALGRRGDCGTMAILFITLWPSVFSHLRHWA